MQMSWIVSNRYFLFMFLSENGQNYENQKKDVGFLFRNTWVWLNQKCFVEAHEKDAYMLNDDRQNKSDSCMNQFGIVFWKIELNFWRKKTALWCLFFVCFIIYFYIAILVFDTPFLSFESLYKNDR